MTTILTKKKDTTGAPAPGDLTNSSGGAELAVNTFDKRLYTKDSGGTVVEVGTNPTIINIDNIQIDGNTISSTDTNGNINLSPNGTGSVVINTDLDVDNVNVNGNTISTTNTNGNLTFTANGTGYYVFSGTQAAQVPAGNNTTERPGTPVVGMLRYNNTSNEFEGYSGSSPAWKSVGGAAISNDTSTSTDVYPAFVDATTGTASTLYTSNAKLLYKPSTGELKVTAPVAANGILVNATTMTANYTIATGTNGLSVGPFTIDSGVTLTINSGQRHLIL
jgi:hypothetical protein